MRTALWVVGLAVGCAGCFCGRPFEPGPGGGNGFGGFGGSGGGNGAFPGCTVQPDVVGGLLRVGEAADVRVALQIVCFDSNRTTDAVAVNAVTVSVIDPENAVVNTTVLPFERTGDQRAARVSVRVGFVPARAGPYTITARFEPDVLQIAGAWLAVVPQADAGFRDVALEAEMQTCRVFGLLASGKPVCLFPDSAALAAGSQIIPGEQFAVDGDAVWSFRTLADGKHVQRWESADGGALVKTHESDPLSIGSGFPALAARGGDAFVLNVVPPSGGDDRWLARFHALPDGGLETSLRSLGPRFPYAVFTAPGHVLVAASPTNNIGTNLIDLEPDGGGTVTVVAGSFNRGPTDDGVMWMPFGSTLSAFEFDAFGIFHSRQLQVPISSSTFDGRLTPHTPVLGFFGADDGGVPGIPSLGPGGIGVEVIDPGAGFRLVSATRTHAFALSAGNTTLRIFDR